MRALIIGLDGFVGKYLNDELLNCGYEVFGTAFVPSGNTAERLNILDGQQVFEVIRRIRPDVVFNMAGQSNTPFSWKEPCLTMELNVNGAVNILEAVRKIDTSIKVFLVGSSDQYGLVSECDSYVDENVPTKPASPYAISKCAQEQMALLYARSYGMRVYLARSFNHIGVGQKKGFVLPDIASGIVDVEKGITDRLMVGNLSAKRDFSDVRDIVRAYRLIVEKGQPNTVYNVGSGNAYCIEDLLHAMLSMAQKEIPVGTDAAKMRKSDVPLIFCNNTKLKRDTGWDITYDIKDTLCEILESFRKLPV